MPVSGRVIVLRLTGSADLEGVWMATPDERVPQFLAHHGAVTTMVPSGDVEWDGDRPAEVWVPRDRLAEWRAEHDW